MRTDYGGDCEERSLGTHKAQLHVTCYSGARRAIVGNAQLSIAWQGMILICLTFDIRLFFQQESPP
jgi:hypothetical protein